MERSKSWPNSQEASNATREAEDRLLSDLTAHAGWRVFEKMVKEMKESMLDEVLIEAQSEWDSIKKERLIKSIDTLSGLLSRVKMRAERYRKKINVIS